MSDITKKVDEVFNKIPYSIPSTTRFFMREALVHIKGGIEMLEVEIETLKKTVAEKDKQILELELVRNNEKPEVAAVVSEAIVEHKEKDKEVPVEPKVEVKESIEVEKKVEVSQTTEIPSNT